MIKIVNVVVIDAGYYVVQVYILRTYVENILRVPLEDTLENQLYLTILFYKKLEFNGIHSYK